MRYRLDRVYENLQIELGKQKLTVKEFSEVVGIPYNTMLGWKKRVPNLLDIVCVCEQLRITLEELLR